MIKTKHKNLVGSTHHHQQTPITHPFLLPIPFFLLLTWILIPVDGWGGGRSQERKRANRHCTYRGGGRRLFSDCFLPFLSLPLLPPPTTTFFLLSSFPHHPPISLLAACTGWMDGCRRHTRLLASPSLSPEAKLVPPCPPSPPTPKGGSVFCLLQQFEEAEGSLSLSLSPSPSSSSSFAHLPGSTLRHRRTDEPTASSPSFPPYPTV